MVNGRDLTLPTRTQTFEQEYSDLTDRNRRPSTPYSINTPQNFSRGSRRMLSRGRQSISRRHLHTPKISQKFAGERKFGLQCCG